MRVSLLAGLLLLAGPLIVAAGTSPASAGDPAPREPRERVEHHLREAEPLIRHFETVLAAGCPHFSHPADWHEYADGEVDRMVLLLAHVEQAWIEAKLAAEDDVRRTAKVPRRKRDEIRTLVDKFQACADDNGATFSPLGVWRRIEREVPRRRGEIALPQ